MEAKEIAAILEEIGVLLELKGENPFKVRAYQSGARALEGVQEELADLLQTGKLAEIKGIGKALSEKIATLATTGQLPFYETLRASVPAGLLEMLEIPGFGPKKVRKVHAELGIDTIAALKAACESGALGALAGFGEKTAANLLRGIENRIAYAMRHIWWDVRAVALPILDDLRGLPEVIRAEVAGSFRRGQETVGDLDFIVAADEPGPVMEWFVSRPEVVEVSAKGMTKSSVRFNGGLQADLRVVPDDRFVFALHHFTGSKEHNVAMRQRALARGLSLSEWGIFDKDTPADAKPQERPLAVTDVHDEQDLFAALGMAYVMPELREGRGEIELAAAGVLPKPLEMADLHGVFHNHTRASDGRHSVSQMAQAAAARGWQYVGIADHSKASFQANGMDEQRMVAQLAEIQSLNREWSGQHGSDKPATCGRAWILAGCEVDILRDGSLDLPRDLLAMLDYCVLSVHVALSGLSEEEMTRRMIRAMETDTGCFKMLGHPTGRLLLRREAYAVQIRHLIDAAAANGVCIELNCNPWRMDLDWRHWSYAIEKGVIAAINPDAHACEDFDYVAMGLLAARKAGLQAAQVLNTLDLSAVKQHLGAKAG